MSLQELFRPKKGKCPRTNFKSRCHEDCELYVEVPKKFDGGDTLIFKGCIERMNYLELANQTQRIAMMQAEIGETKQTNIFTALALLGSEKGRRQLGKILQKAIPNIADDLPGEKPNVPTIPDI